LAIVRLCCSALAQLEIVSALVEEARQRGATVVTGGQVRALSRR
jgi:hypothetical protein